MPSRVTRAPATDSDPGSPDADSERGVLELLRYLRFGIWGLHSPQPGSFAENEDRPRLAAAPSLGHGLAGPGLARHTLRADRALGQSLLARSLKGVSPRIVGKVSRLGGDLHPRHWLTASPTRSCGWSSHPKPHASTASGQSTAQKTQILQVIGIL